MNTCIWRIFMNSWICTSIFAQFLCIVVIQFSLVHSVSSFGHKLKILLFSNFWLLITISCFRDQLNFDRTFQMDRDFQRYFPQSNHWSLPHAVSIQYLSHYFTIQYLSHYDLSHYFIWSSRHFLQPIWLRQLFPKPHYRGTHVIIVVLYEGFGVLGHSWQTTTTLASSVGLRDNGTKIFLEKLMKSRSAETPSFSSESEVSRCSPDWRTWVSSRGKRSAEFRLKQNGIHHVVSQIISSNIYNLIRQMAVRRVNTDHTRFLFSLFRNRLFDNTFQSLVRTTRLILLMD